MMGNLRAFMLTLSALLALGACIAAGASADDFTAEKSPVTVTGKNVSENDSFVTTTGTVNCKNASYVGTWTSPTTSISVTPSYSNCTAFGFPAIISVNGCKYVVNIGAGTTGDADLSCGAGKSVEITAVSAGTDKCTVIVSSQNDITGTVTYLNTGSGTTREIILNASLSGIDYVHNSTGGTGLGICKGGSSTSGTLQAAGVFTGEEDGGSSHVGIFMS